MLGFALERSVKEMVGLKESQDFCIDGTLRLAGVIRINWGVGYNGKSEEIIATVGGMLSSEAAQNIK